MSLPTTLHGQLYLLSLDRRRRVEHRDPILAGMALRAAMLTDLYLSGNITDRGGTPHPVDRAQPVDPVLRAALRRIGSGEYPSWAAAIAPDPKRAVAAVRDQLRSTACIHVGRAIPGLTTPRVTLSDETSIEALAERVQHAVHSAINGTPAEPTALAVGLLGVLGQLPGVFGYEDESRHRARLQALVQVTIEPILGLHQAILQHFEEVRAGGVFM